MKLMTKYLLKTSIALLFVVLQQIKAYYE